MILWVGRRGVISLQRGPIVLQLGPELNRDGIPGQTSNRLMLQRLMVSNRSRRWRDSRVTNGRIVDMVIEMLEVRLIEMLEDQLIEMLEDQLIEMFED
jgi:hypothetical protein